MPRVTISEPGKTPQPYRFKLERTHIKIGRGSENDIVVECASASTHHCTMERVEGGYILRDNGSTNGIKLDDTPMSVIDLFDDMEVLIGDVPMRFQLSDDEIEVLSEEEFTSHQKKKLPPQPHKTRRAEKESKLKPSTSSPRASHLGGYHPKPVVQQGGGGSTLLVLIFMLIAVLAGMTLRHLKETGDFLPAKIMGGGK